MDKYFFLEKFFKNKHILVAVSASIAIYKILDLLSLLNKLGAQTRVVMSESSAKFINPLIFEAISKNPVLLDSNQSWENPQAPNHITYAKWAEVILIAPASANMIAKFACGIADNVALCTLLATPAPKILAPAMNTVMLQATQTANNIATLKTLGVKIIESRVGLLACGEFGDGALAETNDLVAGILGEILKRDFTNLAEFWNAKEVIISGGGSKEAIDNVRTLGNLSSGKQANYLALALFCLGAKVTLISSSFYSILPSAIKCIRVSSTMEYYEAILKARQDCIDKPYLFMAGAIADFKTKNKSKTKLKKENLADSFTLELEKNFDILESLSPQEFIKIGFKAEDNDTNALECAKKMLYKKQCTMVCLNVLDSDNSFGSEYNKMTFINHNSCIQTPLLDKFTLSLQIARFALECNATQNNTDC